MIYFNLILASGGVLLYKLIKPVLENYYVTLENGPTIKNYGNYL